MKNYTALIMNKKFNTFRTLEVNSYGVEGLRERIERLCLKKTELLVSLFPSDKMPRIHR